MTHGDRYVLPEEVAVQVKRVWRIELEDAKMVRLLSLFSGRELHDLLEKNGLPVAGSKEERVTRLAQSYVPATELLDLVGIGELKDACRDCGASPSGAKAEIIEGMVKHFSLDNDMKEGSAAEEEMQGIAEKHGIKTKIDMRHGTPGSGILDAAEDLGIDLIVIGSHKPDLTDYFLGSTAARVVRHAQCPVLVMR